MIVQTNYGKIEGITEQGCQIYRGIPYAKPPVGPLRFHKPQRPDAWEGVYQATQFRNRSMQGPARPGFYHKEFYSNPQFDLPMSEDSLYLNIWVPEHQEDEKLPVAVYVHGGAFMSGAGSNLPFVCDHLARAGVIVVTINYRLGAFGFLCHPLLGVGGNYGLWDQMAALTWVKENIESFGGDAKNVTAFGQSAGAMSLQTLAVSEQAEGLYERMILQSGGGYHNPLGEYRSIERASETAENLLEALGLPGKAWMNSAAERKAAIDALYQTSTEVMMEAIGTVIGKAFQEKTGIPFVPVIDGELLTKDGNELIEEGRYHAISYLLGANGDDLTTEDGTAAPEANRMHLGNIAYAKMINQEQKGTAYVYYFDRKLPGDDAGAFHSAELWYVFGSLEYCWRPLEPGDYALSEQMIACWSQFMKTGDPSTAMTAAWEPCTEANPVYQVFDIKKIEVEIEKLYQLESGLEL